MTYLSQFLLPDTINAEMDTLRKNKKEVVEMKNTVI